MQQIKDRLTAIIAACNDMRALKLILQFAEGILGQKRPPKHTRDN